MAKKEARAIEFTSEFAMMGTIKKMSTFDTKGGGLLLAVETSEIEKAPDILNAKGNVLEITIRVSKQKSIDAGSDDGQEELDLTDSIPAPQEVD